MNLPLIAAEIARRIPELSRDSVLNNALLIENLLRAELARADVCAAKPDYAAGPATYYRGGVLGTAAEHHARARASAPDPLAPF